MKTWAIILVTLVFGILAFISGPVLWPPISDPMPTSSQLPFFIFLSALESLLFGFGVAFIFIAYPKIKNISSSKKTRTILAFISLLWILVSWWPHDNLHMHNGLNFAGLLLIDYGFHLTLMISALILVYYFLTELKAN